MEKQGKNLLESNFWSNKEFWKDVALFAAVMVILYLVYIVVEYWQEITEGFNRGWNSR